MASADAHNRTTAAGAAGTPGRKRLSTLARVAVPIATIVILMLWMMGAFRRGVIQPGRQAVPVESAAGLRTVQIATRTIRAVSEAVGTVQAEQLVSVTARVVANVVEMRVAAGQQVASGEILVVLDDRDLRHRAEQAQEAVRAAEATLAQARSDYQRDKPLFDQQVITPYDFEHTQTNLKTAEANLRRLREAQKEAEVNLSQAVIRSPFRGVVIDRLASTGDLAAPGRPLLNIYEQGRLWLEANVPEAMLAAVRVGACQAVRIDARGRQARGRVAEIVPSSDPATRTVVVRIRLEDTRDVVRGMFGRLLIPAAPEQVLTVPASAVTRAGQLTMVDVAGQGGVERRTVLLGRAIGEDFEVLSGLAAGDTVVLRDRPAARAKDPQ